MIDFIATCLPDGAFTASHAPILTWLSKESVAPLTWIICHVTLLPVESMYTVPGVFASVESYDRPFCATGAIGHPVVALIIHPGRVIVAQFTDFRGQHVVSSVFVRDFGALGWRF